MPDDSSALEIVKMPDASATHERRTNPELREIFPAACEALKPFFDPDTQWENQFQEHFAYRALKERFPQLSAQEILVVVTVARRLFTNGEAPAAP
jgi:hypothetical protein